MERFSYYGMRAVLVLYLTDMTANGGMGWTQADALKLYGIYTGLVYITPIIGGWLADTFLGQRRAILFGAVLMAAGQLPWRCRTPCSRTWSTPSSIRVSAC